MIDAEERKGVITISIIALIVFGLIIAIYPYTDMAKEIWQQERIVVQHYLRQSYLYPPITESDRQGWMEEYKLTEEDLNLDIVKEVVNCQN